MEARQELRRVSTRPLVLLVGSLVALALALGILLGYGLAGSRLSQSTVNGAPRVTTVAPVDRNDPYSPRDPIGGRDPYSPPHPGPQEP